MSRALNALGRWKPGRTFAQSLTAAFLFALTAALTVLSMFISRAEARDRREQDTDHDL